MVGLGNPGIQYARSRHNIGFMAVDLVAGQLGIKLDKNFMRAVVGQGLHKGEKIILAKPQTYMNLSGEAVIKLLNWYKLSTGDMTVIYDDMDLEPGKLKVRHRGGDGGHRGLASIISLLGSGDFNRIRIGIGRPREKGRDVVNWVLGRPDPEETIALNRALEMVPEVLWEIVENGVGAAMNKFNGMSVV
ncbi:aminoacyl-tRNA hydrolase [Desulfotruncus alcoholivorax]|uniref:aminoacyl-tRNA hydrolase n=1 Tax=Desulfotruncus alcoholivorax TaxID=265477 RepID=UPI001EE582E2|nr:aminoacyl-tRNA hydrolase [Desulfotruncus alcoholivorax]